MIPLADSGGANADAFPEPPKGSPGAIRAAGRSLASAGHEVDSVVHGLRGASGALQADWHGWAAGSYMAASQGLETAARVSAETFRACAHAVEAYAGTLEHAQHEIQRLRHLWEHARSAEAAAAGQLGQLALALPGAKPHEAAQMQQQIDGLARQQTTAAGEASGYLRQAHQVLEDFHHEASRQAQVLSGQRLPGGHGPLGGPASPFGPGTMPSFGAGANPLAVGLGGGPNFGVPPGGLAPFNGVIPVGSDPWKSDIPGYGVYMDATHPVEPTDDLTDVVMLASGGLALGGLDALGAAVRDIVSGTAERLGIGTAGRAAVREAGEDAFDASMRAGDYRTDTMLNRLRVARDKRLGGAAEKEVAQNDARASTVENALELADRTGKLPPGVKDVVPHLMRYGHSYRYYALAKLLQARQALEQQSGPAARAAVHAIDHLLGGGG